ncbi:acetyl-coenzyme A synthetase 2 [Geothrix oryzae]|uniref:Acetyl-coenzyme A synthetase n=1 Tax=Geothrix oryzae TaxID=2927975 RepID=A0ABN6V2N7_9BACT|nr:acetate--CoA ligase [Geothrix oryzae]BDU70613.1 acetyl-coenzyme A synthetase 2 [Geothrix oryzae]
MSQDLFPVKPDIRERAHIKTMEEYQRLYRLSLDNPEWFWGEQAKMLTWFHPWQSVFDADYKEVDFSWFMGGRINASFNCIDRHLPHLGDKTAIIWAQDEPGVYTHITYRDLKHNVARVANVLLHNGVKKGDRVCIYLTMIPELVYTMLACARIGAVHSVVFGGFSAESLRDRIVDARCKVVVTANEGLRGGKKVPLKRTVDRAIEGMSLVECVLVARRTDSEVPMQPGRDLWLDEETAKQRSTCTNEWMGAEDPLFILYTSGSTGKPKGLLHTTGGYLTYAAFTHKLVFDYHPEDIYFCAADIGWVTGHSYIVYGPLANGATTVIFESTPLYPDPGRYWQIIDDLGVSIFYTAPTALRALAQAGDDWIKKYSRKSLRILGTVGEPINPEVWRWYHDVVGDARCTVVDTWWQTETGGILITPLPGVTPTKPGSATLPFFGVKPVIVDPATGIPIEGNDVSGALCLGAPWPGQARTVHGDHKRFRETYFTQYPGYYFTGDGARRDEDGYYWITGRIDDVINVSGHRLGTAEVESALVAHEAVAEAAVVGYPHPIKGQGIYCYVLLNSGFSEGNQDQLIGALKEQVRQAIGAFAAPDVIHIAAGLPKTRSGKIMRRILRKIASAEYDGMGDISTLAEPDVVNKLIEEHQKSQH